MKPNALTSAVETLLSMRKPGGHWEGRLSSSALSTATASFALHGLDQATGSNHAELIEKGAKWIAEHQNVDGGWGDSDRSPSNISTSVLCYFTLGALKLGEDARRRAEVYLKEKAGGVDAESISKAILQRYGEDRTFSIPILTLCALAGGVGWEKVMALPFELAVFPRGFYRFLRMPVVSYALPALIAMGLAHHRIAPHKNGLVRGVRNRCEGRALKVLEDIQPAGGGFLEAAPLTSFVLMCLAGSGEGGGVVAKRAREFLVGNVREDGSWPIDTNLETWVTTLAVNALGFSGQLGVLTENELEGLRQWILGRQQKGVHRYTGAAAGGWAWTGLAGGVPDADDTAGAIIALHYLKQKDLLPIERGVQWLLGLQNGDGGIPTFCRGWGKLPFDRSSAELTAHALHAMALWKDALGIKGKVEKAMGRMMGYLRKSQSVEGAWVPLWFGNPMARGEENRAYGTAKVVYGLCGSGYADSKMVKKGLGWIFENQNEDGGWGAERGVMSSVEETGCVLMAIHSAGLRSIEGEQWLSERIKGGFGASAIGLYFAKLWYYEEMYPVVFGVGGLG